MDDGRRRLVAEGRHRAGEEGASHMLEGLSTFVSDQYYT